MADQDQKQGNDQNRRNQQGGQRDRNRKGEENEQGGGGDRQIDDNQDDLGRDVNDPKKSGNDINNKM